MEEPFNPYAPFKCGEAADLEREELTGLRLLTAGFMGNQNSNSVLLGDINDLLNRLSKELTLQKSKSSDG